MVAAEPRRLPDLDGIELWLVEGPGTERERSHLYNLLSEDERERASRFKVEEARRSFIVSRGFLRTILGHALGCAPASISFGEGEHGKPFLAGAHGTSEIEFNVSHSGDFFLQAVSRDRTVGVDVERKREGLAVEKLARRYFAAAEASCLIEDVPREERLDGFYRRWTRKEAYLKARGTGLTTRLHTPLRSPSSPAPRCSTPRWTARIPRPGGSSTSRCPTAMSRLWWHGDRPPPPTPHHLAGPRHSHPTSEARAEMATLMDEMEEHLAAQREVEALLNAE